jgi:hypothetical protein
MKTYLNNSKLVLTAILVGVFCLVGKSQTINVKAEKNNYSFKIDNYTTDVECKLIKMFEETKGVKVVFSCITAGLLIIESKELAGSYLEESLRVTIKSVNEKTKFELMEEHELVRSTPIGNLTKSN